MTVHLFRFLCCTAITWLSLSSCGVDSRWGAPSSSQGEKLALQHRQRILITPQPKQLEPVLYRAQPAVAATPVPLPLNYQRPLLPAPQVAPISAPTPIQRINHLAQYSASQPIRLPLTQSGVRLVGKKAIAPAHAPAVVHRAVAAGNRLQNKPYRFGGGHAILNDTGYDCSGTVSYVLREAGLMKGQMPSRGFLNYGEAGTGNWITVWAKDGHVFMTIGGLRLDTGGNGGGDGPRWRTKTRKKSGFTPRHPHGL